MMMCAHGRIDECQVIATGLRERYENTRDPDIGVVGDFVQIMVHALRGDVEASINTGRHMTATFPPAETVTDPMHSYIPGSTAGWRWARPRVAIGDAMREYAQRALDLARSRGDVFNILAAKLALVESAAILGDTRGTAAAGAVGREFAAAGGHQWGAAARIIGVWGQTVDTGDGDPTSAFDAFDVLTADGTCAMNGMFLGLLADNEYTTAVSNTPRSCWLAPIPWRTRQANTPGMALSPNTGPPFGVGEA